MKLTNIMVILILLTVGCRDYQIPEADLKHPANPDAPAAAEIPQAKVLDTENGGLQIEHSEIEKKSERDHNH